MRKKRSMRPRPRGWLGGEDQLHLQIRRGLPDVLRGEVNAVVGIENARDAADGPMRVLLAPDPLAQSQSGAEHGRRLEGKIVACNRSAVVVDHDREPGLGDRAVVAQDHDVQLGVIGLPDRIRTRCFSPVHKVEVLAVDFRTVMRERQQTGRELPNDGTNQPVARKRFTLSFRELPDLAVDRPAGKPREFQSQAYNQPPHLWGDDTVGAAIGASLARESRQSMFPIEGEPASGSTEGNSSFLRHREKRLPLLQVRLEQPKT